MAEKTNSSEIEELENKIKNHEAYGKPYTWSAKDFELGSLIGRGCFGCVHDAREKKTGLIVAMKTLYKSQIVRFSCQKEILEKIGIHYKLKHKNILRLHTWFHDERNIHLVLEYALGDKLCEHLKRSAKGCFSEKKAAKYLYQIADGVEYCHQNHLILRNINTENILVGFNGDIKLFDFGCSVHTPSQSRKSVCSTPPEIIKGEECNAYVDHWAIGILLYEFLVGKPPFGSRDEEQIFANILNLGIVIPETVPETAKDLIFKLLKIESIERLPLPEVKEHYWVQANYVSKINK